MQLANDAADVACLQAFGRLGAIGMFTVATDVLFSQRVTRLPPAALLDVIKRVRGAAQKNAAIAGARVLLRFLWLAVFDV